MELVSVNVGEPAPLRDDRSGRVVQSGIRKHRVGQESVRVGRTNIDGDGQADLVAHGGVDKAVYTYSLDHIPAWTDEIGYGDGTDAPFGENLSVQGVVEDDVRIGDRWQWGDAILEVAQPRWPCFKLGLRSGHHDLPALLIASERSGWYSRVAQMGEAPTRGTLILIERDPDAPTVRETFQAARGLVDAARAETIVSLPTLAARWREMIARRYDITLRSG